MLINILAFTAGFIVTLGYHKFYGWKGIVFLLHIATGVVLLTIAEFLYLIPSFILQWILEDWLVELILNKYTVLTAYLVGGVSELLIPQSLYERHRHNN